MRYSVLFNDQVISDVVSRGYRGRVCFMGAERMERLDSAERVAQRVNHLMFINGRMTQRRLGSLIGIAAPTVAVKMTGRNRWSLEDLLSLCEVFGVSPNYMLGFEPIEAASPQKEIAPAARAAGAMTLVAGAGFEPTTSGL